MTTKSGKTLDDFRAVHDKGFVVPNKIKVGLEKLTPQGWEYEADFVKSCGVSINDFSIYREQFTEFYVVVKDRERKEKRVWAGSKALAAKLREMV